MDIFLYLVCSCIFGALGAWFIFRWGNSFGLLDRSNNRSSHGGVVPKGGGVGILAAFLFVSVSEGLPALWWIPVSPALLLSRHLSRIPSRRLAGLHQTVKKWLAEDAYDTHRFEETYGFQTNTSLEEALKREVDWYLDSRLRGK